jgi:Tol biopolymer transport system component/tRNA A-37 threonylcarbamoyl transferase component Bud32
MNSERWQLLSDWHNAWLAADSGDRDRLRQQFAERHPGLAGEADALASASAGLPGFLETPALALAARDLAQDDALLNAGAVVGPYQIIELLARGGMGDVYRARDVRLQRNVALKHMARAGMDDPQRTDRFLREARVTAALDHANIVKVFDVGVLAGRPYMVEEFLDGETLRARLRNGLLTTGEARRIAGEVAAGLVVAHAAGLVHRDLKPDNIFLTRSGVTKILDFGIAKTAVTGEPIAADGLATLTGVLLGTASYLAPEQIRGEAVDGRTDLFALGSMLFEMTTGHRAFAREHTIDTLHAIVHDAQPGLLLQSAVPLDLEAIVARLLQKAPAARFQSAADLAWVLSQGAQPVGPAEKPLGGSARVAWPRPLAWALAILALGATAIGGWVLQAPAAAPELRLEMETPPTHDLSLALSPDGLRIAFAAKSDGPSRLWVRALDASEAQPIPGTERASSPFWSPDGRSLGFFADARLKRMDLADGSVRTLAITPAPLGGAWGRDDTILLSTNPGNPIYRIAAGGGPLVAVTRFASSQQGLQSSPWFLPDGRHFLFFVAGQREARGVYLGQLGALESTRLLDAEAPAVYTSTGHLLFVREGKLLAQAFDPNRLELRGKPVPIANRTLEETTLSASAAGPIAYRRPSAESGQRQFAWLDRSGRELNRVVYPDTSAVGPSLSRDGRRVAVFRFVSGNMDIWSYDTGRRTWDRLTVDPGDDIFPLWSPDGTGMVFGSNRNGGRMNLFRTFLGAAPASEELLLSTSQPKFPMDWSSDGRFLLYESLDPGRGFDIWALPLAGDKQPFAVVQTDFNDRLPQFSPDGKWVAYQSDKTGRFEIYLRPFPGPGPDTRVSIDGGTQVRWDPSGKELFFIAADARLMSVPVRFASQGEVEPGKPIGLFATNTGSSAMVANRQEYAVAPDGQSFVMNSALIGPSAPPISVILNWKPTSP